MFELAAWSAAGGLALVRGRTGGVGCGPMALALGCGAIAARLGWGLLHYPRVLDEPGWLVAWNGGFCLLFVPLGPVLVGASGGRERIARMLCALAPAMGVAKLGCALAGCCGARLAFEGPVGGRWLPLGEALGWLALARGLTRARLRGVPSMLMLAMAALRLASDALRAEPPFGPAQLSVGWIAGLWGLLAVCWWVADLARPRAPHAPLDCD